MRVRHGLRPDPAPGEGLAVQLRHKAFLRRVQALREAGEDELLVLELRLYESTRCGARTRRDTPCKRVALRSGRCPNHGGLSTGPRTLAGRLRSLAHLRQFRGLSLEEIRQIVEPDAATEGPAGAEGVRGSPSTVVQNPSISDSLECDGSSMRGRGLSEPFGETISDTRRSARPSVERDTPSLRATVLRLIPCARST